MTLSPVCEIGAEEAARGRVALVRDAAYASLAGSLYGGVVLVGFALAMGASPLTIGLLAALPAISQLAQLPTIALVERTRQRKRIAVLSVTAARVCILALAFVPYAVDVRVRLALLVVLELLISMLGAVGGCALNSWLHQFLPKEGLGTFLAQRLFWGTGLGCVGALAAGVIVDRWPFANPAGGYSVVFAAGALAGFLSSLSLAQVPEPVMGSAGPPATMIEKMKAPFGDRNFRRLLVFTAAWNVASNVAAPFIAVYLMEQMGYKLTTVVGLSVASQLANAFTVYAWGRVSDRLSNKAILAVALPLYFACLLGLMFAAIPHPHTFTLPLLVALHLFMGAAAGGIGLASSNVSLKLAPAGQGTAYLAAVSLTVAAAGGVAPIAGGAIAEWLKAAQLSILVRFTSTSEAREIVVITFAHWEFLLVISAAAGLYVMHALSRIEEGRKYAPREVVQELAVEAGRTINQLSSIGGMFGGIVNLGRLIERRLVRRT
jgi:MFS family permease